MKKSLLFVLPLCTTLVFGARVTHTDYTSGAVISASGQNSNENTIFNEFNGNIDNTNIKTGGISNANIPANTLTGDRLLTTDTSLHTSSGTIDQFNSSTYTLLGYQVYGIFQSTTVVIGGAECTTSNAYAGSAKTISITPKRATSRIEITASTTLRTPTGAASSIHLTLFRNSTNIVSSASDICNAGINSAVQQNYPCSINYFDSPGVTTATSYTLKIKNDDNSSNVCMDSAITGTPNTLITVKEWSY